MCDTCGCNVTPGNEHLVAAGGHLAKTSTGHESVEVLKGLLDANDHLLGVVTLSFALATSSWALRRTRSDRRTGRVIP